MFKGYKKGTASPKRYEADVKPAEEDVISADESDLEKQREISRERMERSYADMLETYKRQQDSLSKKPDWVPTRLRNAKEPHELTVTHVKQTTDMFRADGIAPQFSENQNSVDWLKTHSIEHMNLTLKDLVNKGKVCRPTTDEETGKRQQHLQFEATDINEFEYKLNLAIDMYTTRLKWLLQGSKRVFGMVKGARVGLVVDCSDANFGFGRGTAFLEALTHFVDEQLAMKSMLYLVKFGTDTVAHWTSAMEVRPNVIEEAKQWVNDLYPRGGCNLLNALKHVYTVEELDTICIVLGSVPDQTADVLCDYIGQLGVGQEKTIYAVAYDCNNQHTNIALRKLAEESGGNYHCYATGSEEQIYTGTDISVLLTEVQKTQDLINKIKEMRRGLLGTALVSVKDEIKGEIAKLPPSRFLPHPPGHDHPLVIDVPKFHAVPSSEWLSNHGLKAKGLDLYQVLAPNAFSYREEFIPVIRKTVQSQVHEKAMAQFQWHDGSIKNIHVDMTQLFEYQKQLGSTVKLYEKRIDWLSSASRRIFGTVTGKNVVILVDLAASNANYLIHIQHSLRLLLQQQISNKDYFNIIGFGGDVKKWQNTMVKPTPENLQAAWRWVLDMQCSGSRNFMGGLRAAVENDEEQKHYIEVDGLYLFTSGIPDQSAELCQSYVEETTAGRSLKLHIILFNVDDYDSQGAIPSRYANITKTAEVLRTLAHCSEGRFHWFRETGIIESDDIADISFEIEKALNFSKKCAMLIESVKKKYNIDYGEQEQLKMLEYKDRTPVLPTGTTLRSLPPARPNKQQTNDESAPKALSWRPSSATKRQEESAVSVKKRPSSAKEGSSVKDRPSSARDPMQKIKSKKVQKAFFYTDSKAEIGTVITKYPSKKSVRRGIPLTLVTEKEDHITTREWMRMYSLSKLKLDLNKLVSGPDCKHVSKPVKALNKTVEARTCNIFPTINVAGTLRRLQLLPHELVEYEEQVERVLTRYLKRLTWILTGSMRVFGAVVEKSCVFLIDTSGSMEPHMEELKKELAALIWDQLHKHSVRFNLISFSKKCERWQPVAVAPTEEKCHDAVRWVSDLEAHGNTCTLDALQMAFEDQDISAVYLLTDGKPDCSTSLVLKEVGRLNAERKVKVNTISFNCADETADTFLRMFAKETGGRYHQVPTNFDAELFVHKLLSDGFKDPQHPILPDFPGDDLKRLAEEISLGRRYLAQSRSYRVMYEELQKMQSDKASSKHDLTVGPGQKNKTT